MPSEYTMKIDNGSDLKVNSYLMRTAGAMGLFVNSRGGNIDLAKLSRKELVKLVQNDMFPDCENTIRIEIAGALYDNLPGGEIIQKRSKLAIQEPNEHEALFGRKYRNIEHQKPKDQIALFQEIVKMIKSSNDEQKAKLLTKKIGYEQKNYEYSLANDNAKRARYDGMINHVEAWSPQYKNPEDAYIEEKCADYFETHKDFALNQLEESKENHCHSDEWLEIIKAEHLAKMEKLNKTKPADFVNMLQNKVTSHINNITSQMQEKQKGE